MASFEGLKKQLLELEPGERLSYHIGNLAEDRQKQTTVHKIAILCQGLQILGRARLNIQRLDKNRFVYFVTILANSARRLQGSDLTRAWTIGQEQLSAQADKR